MYWESEFYGQGEAARLADRVGEQMRLIDENLDLSTSSSYDRRSRAGTYRGRKSGDRALEQSLEKLQVEAADPPSSLKNVVIVLQKPSQIQFLTIVKDGTGNGYLGAGAARLGTSYI